VVVITGPASFTKVRVVTAVLPTLSVPVTVSVGLLVVFADQVKVADTYGPFAGVDTTDPVWAQPVAVPPRVGKVLEAGPEPPVSVSELVRVKDPADEPL
jgi:hypothetical protein